MAIQTVNSSGSSNRRLHSRSLTGSSSGATDWIRPVEWPALPPITASDEKFVGVAAIFNTDGNYLALKAAGNYTVDWGDGTVENISSGTQVNHQYSYGNASLVPTSYGYKCAVVTVIPQAGQQLTSLDLSTKPSTVSLGNGYTAAWLDIALSLPNCSASGLNISSSSASAAQPRNLQQARLLNIGGCTSLAYLFKNAASLRKVTLGSTAAVQNISYMFNNCYSLQVVNTFDTSAATDMAYLFQNCYSIQSVPAFTTAAVQRMSYMFSGCYSLQSIPALDQSSITAGNVTSFAPSSSSLVSSSAAGCKYSIDYSSCSLSKTNLETIFTNLGRAFDTSQAVTITSNYGSDTTVSKSSCGTTTGSATITTSSTSSLSAGMICTGTGISTGVAVTFQDSSDTVTLAGHGLANGTMVSFSAITSTTGIVTYTNYWVVNATTNTFQVASIQGGNALALTTDGSGTMLYPSYIVSITPNTSVTLSAPASATGTVTLSFRKLDIFRATSKGWVITG